MLHPDIQVGAALKIRRTFFGAVKRYSQKTVELSSRKNVERSGAVERKFQKITIFLLFFIFREKLLKRDHRPFFLHRQDLKLSLKFSTEKSYKLKRKFITK